MTIGTRWSRFRMGGGDRRFSRALIPVHEDRYMTVRRLLYGVRAAQRSASGAPLAGMENGTADGTERTFVIATIHGPRQRRPLQGDVRRPVIYLD